MASCLTPTHRAMRQAPRVRGRLVRSPRGCRGWAVGYRPSVITKEEASMGGIVGILVVVLIVLAIIYFARRT
jgi:hypothetical protein